MLAILAFAMVATFMTLIMTRRMSALTALALVPILFGTMAGFGTGLGAMMLDGIRQLAPTGVMLLFAILYFGVMIDAGLFDPLIARIVRLVHGDPMRTMIGTAALALVVSLDGDGTTTYMITVAAMLPLYRAMRLDARKMACLIIMASGIANLLPWGGPTARAAAALKLDPSVLFVPMIPGMIGCIAWLGFVAWLFGRQERARLVALGAAPEVSDEQPDSDEDDRRRDPSALRPKLFFFNLALTSALLIVLILGVLPLPALFVIAFAVAVMVNYPSLAEQKKRMDAHAGNALSVVSLIFAAGIFMGILSGTRMVDAMAASVTGLIPPALNPYLAPITALISVPFTFLISNDAFYFGMLPVLAQTGAANGIAPEAIARASLVGQQIHLLSPLVPSTYLLVGMAKIEFGEHQRFTMGWAFGACTVMLVICLLVGAFPLAA